MTNRSPGPVPVQLRVLRWTQEGGEEQLMPTTDVVVSPPVALIQPGAMLSARVLRVRPAPVAAEEAYRLLLDELPDAASGPRKGGSLSMLMRYSIPAFFRPPGSDEAPPPLVWGLEHSADRGWRLQARNPGTRRVRLSAVKLAAPGRAPVTPLGDTLTGYVLAGQQMAWGLKLPADFPVRAGTAYALDYDTEAGARSETLRLQIPE